MKKIQFRKRQRCKGTTANQPPTSLGIEADQKRWKSSRDTFAMYAYWRKCALVASYADFFPRKEACMCGLKRFNLSWTLAFVSTAVTALQKKTMGYLCTCWFQRFRDVINAPRTIYQTASIDRDAKAAHRHHASNPISSKSQLIISKHFILSRQRIIVLVVVNLLLNNLWNCRTVLAKEPCTGNLRKDVSNAD
jgi:hypothetical protein